MGTASNAVSDVYTRANGLITGAPLTQPIRGGVSKDGRLVFADDALRRLHMRAGGVEGGILAIPGLAALAALAHQLKMKLSRAVKVADANEDLDLWVEAYLDGDETRLSIVSWRASAAHKLPEKSDVTSSDVSEMDDYSTLDFDAELRLLSADGLAAGRLDRTDFGKVASDVLSKLLADASLCEMLTEAMHESRAFEHSTIAKAVAIFGEPLMSGSGKCVGYRCHLKLEHGVVATEPSPEPPSILFGRQLAPVLRQPLGRIIANADKHADENVSFGRRSDFLFRLSG